jgi:hypothetical protein
MCCILFYLSSHHAVGTGRIRHSAEVQRSGGRGHYGLAHLAGLASVRGRGRPSCFARGEPSCLPIGVDLAVRDSDRAALATGTTKLSHWVDRAPPRLRPAANGSATSLRIAIRGRAPSAPKARSNEPVVRGMSDTPARGLERAIASRLWIIASQLCRSEAPAADLRWSDWREDQCLAAQVAVSTPRIAAPDYRYHRCSRPNSP